MVTANFLDNFKWLSLIHIFYGSFILDMDRSPGFGSTLTDFSPY